MMYRTEIITASVLSAPDYVRAFRDAERFAVCCRACPDYGRVWTCPPFGFDPADRLQRFRCLYVVGTKVWLDEELRHAPSDAVSQREISVRILTEARRGMDERLLALETEYPGSLAFFAGSCSVCPRERCTRRNGEACRYPGRARSSLEAYGFDVSRTASEILGVPLKWSENFVLPEYFLSVGGLFAEREIPAFADRFGSVGRG